MTASILESLAVWDSGVPPGLRTVNTWESGVSTSQLFKGDGFSLRATQNRRMNNPVYQHAWFRFREAYGEAMHGNRRCRRFIRALMEGEPVAYMHLLEGAPQLPRHPSLRITREALSTNDFPLLFGDTIDRLLLAKYDAYPQTWRDYIKTSTVQDFRDVKRFRCSPGRGLLPVVGQGGSYKADVPTETSYSFAVSKHGGVRNIFWEALINDDLGALADVPDDFAFQAAQTEWYQSASKFVANTTLYATNHSAEDGNAYSNKGTAALTTESLATALSAIGQYPGNDVDGTPVMNDIRYIVVGTREMEFKAQQILNSPLVMYTGSTDAANLPTDNLIPPEVRNAIQVRFNPFIRMLDGTNYATSWYLFSDPMFGYAIEFSFLAGYEAPSLFMRAESQIMLGGMAAPTEGGFDNDSVDYKVRHVMGGSHTNAVGGWRFSYWSDGTV
jgi:hypothetical protein